jgi:hypothetical protein
MIDLSTFSIIIASIGVLAGVAYNVISIQHQNKLKKMESLIRLSPWLNMSANDVQEAITQVCSIKYKTYDDYLEKYSGKSEQIQLKILSNYFESLGILVHRKLVDVDIIYDFWGSIIQSTWKDLLPIVEGMRKSSGDANMFVFWEYLYNELQKYMRSHKSTMAV